VALASQDELDAIASKLAELLEIDEAGCKMPLLGSTAKLSMSG